MLLVLAEPRRVGHALTLVACLAGGSTGCGGRHDVVDEPDPDPLAPTSLTVNNNNWLDVVIFVFHDGELSRAGTVTAASTANFLLPAWMLGQSRSIRLVGHPIGSAGSINTELIHIQPGQFIEWRVESQLVRSSVAVY